MKLPIVIGGSCQVNQAELIPDPGPWHHFKNSRIGQKEDSDAFQMAERV
ncbi:hypothetical protein [Rhodopirellula sp. SWK7]|nr:hypothetical protein [Rhodopirellula sp. SWK7]EMI46035.1 hypothetical protein RRSWK_01503 [Rhodopirellula sp. SWK7]